MPEVPLEKSLAIIGDEDVILGFQSLGFKVYGVRDAGSLKGALDEIAQQQTAVCLVQDDLYRLGQEQINSYRNLALPIFVPFKRNIAESLLGNIVKDIRLRATGTF